MSLSSEGTPDLVAFEQLVAEYGDRVYGIALRVTGSPSDAEDVMQDAFLQAFRSWSTFRGEVGPDDLALPDRRQRRADAGPLAARPSSC